MQQVYYNTQVINIINKIVDILNERSLILFKLHILTKIYCAAVYSMVTPQLKNTILGVNKSVTSPLVTIRVNVTHSTNSLFAFMKERLK